MMDVIWLLGNEILLLGDFNIDLQKTHPRWHSLINSYNLTQCISPPTRLKPNSNSSTLLDHIYTSNIKSLKEICVPVIGVSDHNAVCITWNKTGFKIPKSSHTLVHFRSFKHFELHYFQSDLYSSHLKNVYGYDNPDDALLFWIDTFLNIVNKHMPLIQR